MRHVLTLSALVVIAAAFVAVAAVVGSGLCAANAAPDRTAVVDRIGADDAVLLVERGDGTSEQRVVDPGTIPESGRHEGAVLDVTREGYVYDRTATEGCEHTFSRRFDALAERT
jgi:hypothetical protein